MVLVRGCGWDLGTVLPKWGGPICTIVFSSVLSLVGPGVTTAMGMWVGDMTWAGQSVHLLGECLSDCVSGSKEQVTPGGTVSRKLSG